MVLVLSLMRDKFAVFGLRFVVDQTDLKSVVKKIACDEAVFAPQLACSYLATSAYIHTPGDWNAVKGNVKDKVRERRFSSIKCLGQRLMARENHETKRHGKGRIAV